MAQITLGGSLGHSNPVLSIIDILDAQGGMRTVSTFTNGALSTEFSSIPNKIKQYVSSITVQDTNTIYYLTGLTATETGSWTALSSTNAGAIGGTGTTNYLVKFTGATSIGDSNIIEDINGSIGIGTTATSFAKVNILTTAISGRESILTAQVSDNSDDRYILANGTTVANRFIPAHIGYVGGTYSSLVFRGLGLAASDSGISPYVAFLAANTTSSTDPNNGTLSNPVSKPLFTWGSVTESMRILANGNLGINTTLPVTKLHVAATNEIATFEYTGMGLSAGDNFTFNSLIFGDDISLQATRGLNTTRIIGYNADGQAYFNEASMISYPDQSTRFNGAITFAQTIEYDINIGNPTAIISVGEIVHFGLSPTGLTAGNIYYYSSSNTWLPAGATVNGDKLLGIPLGATVSNGILIKGFSRFPANSNYSFTSSNNGDRQYLTSGGSFSAIAPTGSGSIIRILGYQIDDDKMYFNPDNTWVEL